MTSLAYSPSVLGAPTALTIGFTGSHVATPGDEVGVVLPGFTGASRVALGTALIAGDLNYFDAGQASWRLSSRTLTLVVGAALAAGTPVTVVVGTSAEISLPPTALAQDQPKLKISLVACAALTLAAPVGFGHTRIAFRDPPVHD